MNILFIYSTLRSKADAKPIPQYSQIPFGISYLSSYIKAHGHHSGLLALNRALGKENRRLIVKSIDTNKPKLILFTAVSAEYPYIIEVAKFIRRRYPGIFLMIGGSHVSLNPESALKHFNALCIGEGEQAVLEAVEQIEKGKYPSGIQNLWIRKGRDIEKNRARPFLQDLDILPFPDRKSWDPWVEKSDFPMHTVIAGRGCPFNCSYCSNHALRKLAPGRYVRLRQPSAIVKEITELKRLYPSMTHVFLESECINAQKQWTLALCRELERLNASIESPLAFGTNVRITAGADLDQMFKAFKRSGFSFIRIGIETGSENLRRNILDRFYTNDDVIHAVQLARKHGLLVTTYNMIGLPYETIDDIKKTVEINRKCLPDWVYLTMFYPYPGTELHALCKQKRLLRKPQRPPVERWDCVVKHDPKTLKLIEHEFIWFYYEVFKGHKPEKELIGKVLSDTAEMKSLRMLNKHFL